MNCICNEAYAIDTSQPSTLLWCNGTTDKRFDIGSNVWRSVTGGASSNELSPLSPMYLTSNVKYALKCLEGHVSKDFGAQAGTPKHDREAMKHGLLVLAQLKSGVKLFDFTDKADFKDVFGDEHADEIAELFDGAEPYFAFNSGIANAAQRDVPIEFSIAQKMLVWMLSGKNKMKHDAKTAKSSTVITYFTDKDQSFIKMFKKMDAASLSEKLPIKQDDYENFIDFYNGILEYAEITTSKTGRKQARLHGGILKVLPDKIDSKQLRKVNSYMHLMLWCIDNRDLLSSLDSGDKLKADFDKVLDTTDAASRVKYVDLLQACLYIGLYMSGYPGFYCPEFIASKNKSTGDAPSIALFDSNAIDKIESIPLPLVREAAAFAANSKKDGESECLATVHALRDELHKLDAYKKAESDARQARRKAIETGKWFQVDAQYKRDADKELYDFISQPWYRELAQSVERSIEKFEKETMPRQSPEMKGLTKLSPRQLVRGNAEILRKQLAASKPKQQDKTAQHREDGWRRRNAFSASIGDMWSE